MFSTRYIIIFTLLLTTIVALGLSGIYYATFEKAKLNEKLFNKRGILIAISPYLDKEVDEMSDEDVVEIFDTRMEQIVLDMNGNQVETAQVVAAGYKDGRAEDVDMAKERKKPLDERLFPLFVFDKGDGKVYIISVRGNGLWDEIWGSVGIESDLNTIVGAAFDHKAETPGLGAEIKDNAAFRDQFQGKRIYDEDGNYISVAVRKGGARDVKHEVDGISGATITGDGVTEMLFRGIQYYQPYFSQISTNE